MLNRGVKLGPREDGCETVLRTENDFEVGEERTGNESDDVQADVDRVGESVMNPRNRDTKCEFTLRPATLGFRADVSRQENSRQILSCLQEIALMNRRPLALLVLVLASMVASACSEITAPRHGDTSLTCTGYIDQFGRCITP